MGKTPVSSQAIGNTRKQRLGGSLFATGAAETQTQCEKQSSTEWDQHNQVFSTYPYISLCARAPSKKLRSGTRKSISGLVRRTTAARSFTLRAQSIKSMPGGLVATSHWGGVRRAHLGHALCHESTTCCGTRALHLWTPPAPAEDGAQRRGLLEP
ncbi:hypothetical protein BCR44DRAFT_1451791 [Catenaria anguillulae PL171]|uniref:Uncharacterized protein n=1 Tax=Catenaria anguillulae PL171 TaxID=765915 RepID=A0A1Y2H4A7_9FUNG|nr:hypothetical protein BCR44DRAFT_1451791 [Catenaria anguillulae PL171]